MELFEESIELIDTIAKLRVCSHDEAVQFLFEQYMEKSFYESLGEPDLLKQPIELR